MGTTLFITSCAKDSCKEKVYHMGENGYIGVICEHENHSLLKVGSDWACVCPGSKLSALANSQINSVGTGSASPVVLK